LADFSDPKAFVAALFAGRNRRTLITVGAIALLCLLIGIVATVLVSQHRQVQQSRVLVREALAVEAQYQARVGELDQRLAQIGFEPYLRPNTLVTREGVGGGIAMLRQYRGLLAERRSQFDAYVADVNRTVEAVPPGAWQDAAREGAFAGVELARKMQLAIDAPQRAHADAIEALLDWAWANNGWFAERNGRFEFQTPKQQTELVKLAQGLDASSKRVLAAAGEAQTLRVQGEAPRQAALVKAQKLLQE
jgi:hypothetical protein